MIDKGREKMDVSIVRCADYGEETCERALREVLVPFGGLDWVRPGMRARCLAP